MRDELIEADLIDQIEAYCKRHGMPVTKFGALAINDTALVSRLRKGRQLLPKTRRKVELALNHNPGDSAASSSLDLN